VDQILQVVTSTDKALPPVRQRERRFRVHQEAPGFRPAPREKEGRFRVYKEAPGFRPGPRGSVQQTKRAFGLM